MLKCEHDGEENGKDTCDLRIVPWRILAGCGRRALVPGRRGIAVFLDRALKRGDIEVALMIDLSIPRAWSTRTRSTPGTSWSLRSTRISQLTQVMPRTASF